MVRDEVLATVTTALEGPVSVAPERRGFDHRRGVPDSVFWLTPDDERFTCRPLPILVELEGTFANAADDFAKFADRYDDCEYQYSVQAPIIGETGLERQLEGMRYDIIGIRSNLLGGNDEIDEARMHAEFTSWFKRFKSNIRTQVSVRRYLPQPVVEWGITFTMFGHEFETVVPFVLAGTEPVGAETVTRLPTPTIPGIVVVNNKHDSRDQTELQHDTALEFPSLHPIRFRD